MLFQHNSIFLSTWKRRLTLFGITTPESKSIESYPSCLIEKWWNMVPFKILFVGELFCYFSNLNWCKNHFGMPTLNLLSKFWGVRCCDVIVIHSDCFRSSRAIFSTESYPFHLEDTETPKNVNEGGGNLTNAPAKWSRLGLDKRESLTSNLILKSA